MEESCDELCIVGLDSSEVDPLVKLEVDTKLLGVVDVVILAALLTEV